VAASRGVPLPPAASSSKDPFPLLPGTTATREVDVVVNKTFHGSPTRRRTSSTRTGDWGLWTGETGGGQRMAKEAGRNVEYVAFCKDVDILRA